MKEWKSFESRVKQESLMQGISCVKIPEHMFITKHGKQVRKKTEFDYCAGIDGIAAFFDCKSSSKNNLNFKTYVLGEEKVHQFNALVQVDENLNIGGYLIYFYELRVVSWANIKVIKALIAKGDKSLTPDSNGVVSQLDDVPINLRTLLWEDRARVVEKLCK